MTAEKCKEFKSHGVTSLESLLHLRKENLHNATKRILTTERSQSEFMKVVNELPVLSLGAKLTIVEKISSDTIFNGTRNQDQKIVQNKNVQNIPLEFTRHGTVFNFNGNGKSDGEIPSGVGPSSAALDAPETKKTSQNHENNVETAFLTAGTEYEMKFSINNLHGNSKASVFCPQYHRSKTASYWCIVGNEEGQLLSMKKIIPSGGQSVSSSVTFTIPITAHTLSQDIIVNEKIVNPNDKLYMNYTEDYKNLQNEHKQQQEKKGKEKLKGTEQDLLIFLVSDSVMGLDDALRLPFRA